MTCPHCQTENVEDARFCQTCGRTIGPTATEGIPPSGIGDPTSAGRGNPGLWTGLYWGGFGCLLLGMVVGAEDPQASASVGFLVFLGFGLLLAALIIGLKILHRCWTILQGAGARTTPGAAIGLMFVPLFNLYWVFQSIRGLAIDSEAFMSRAGRHSPITEGLSTAYCILTLASIVPVVGSIASIPALIILNILIYQWSRFLDEVAEPSAAPA